jgi:hypothetical protein
VFCGTDPSVLHVACQRGGYTGEGRLHRQEGEDELHRDYRRMSLVGRTCPTTWGALLVAGVSYLLVGSSDLVLGRDAYTHFLHVLHCLKGVWSAGATMLTVTDGTTWGVYTYHTYT